MALTTAYIRSQLKEILPIGNTNAYDTQLDILIEGAVSKLESEGVPNTFDTTSTKVFDYIICVAYQVSIDMDFDVDHSRLNEQYLTRVNTLRTWYANENNS